MARLNAFRSPFFWNLYLSYALVVVITTSVIGFLVDYEIGQLLVDDVEVSLHEKADLLEPLSDRAFVDGDREAFQVEVERLGKAAKTRITFVRADGTVVADSREKPFRMDNHRDRPEVRAALERRYGVANRVSATMGLRLIYVARAVEQGGEIAGVVRVAVPLEGVGERMASMRLIVLAGAAFGVISALVVGFFVARRITAPVAQMTEIASAIRDGHYGRRATAIPNNEIGVLAETLNELCSALTERIAETSRDRAQFQAILAGMVEGVLAVDHEDRILFCNRAARQVLGVGPPDTLRGKVLQTSVQELHELLRDTRSERTTVRREFRVTLGGQELILDAYATPFRGDDIEGTVVLLHDISNLRRLENIRRDFVANVSHELKTPLTSIKGFVETLLSGAIHDEKNNVRFLKKIENHVERLTHLVVDLLTLARIESHEASRPLGPASWAPIVRDAMRRFDTAIQAKGLVLSVETAGEPILVLGDADGMSQVLENLLDNAIKYTPDGGQVRLRTFVESHSGVLEVTDTGIGIPDADREHIFERFYRVDKARSRELGGTGLGLSIVKHLVHSMAGDIEVESAIGRGSTFRVTIPLASAA